MEQPLRSPNKLRSRGYDTGFPEPFCGSGNTTLRHPDADTSPNASISASDIDGSRAMGRSRRTFLAKHRRAVNYGKLHVADMDGVAYGEMISIAERRTDSDLSSSSASFSEEQFSKDGSESTGRSSSSAHGEAPSSAHGSDDVFKPLSPVTSESRHHNGFFKRLRVHD